MPTTPALHYETIATAFQVVDIAQALRTVVSHAAVLEDVWAAIMEDALEHADNWFALVRDEEKIIGYIALDSVPETGDEKADDPKQALAGRICKSITPDQIVAASLPLLYLIPLFQQHYFFFVLTSNNLTHVVSFQDLDQLPVKLCLFALLTGLEAECLRLFLSGPHTPHTLLERLPPGRYEKAHALCRERDGRATITPERILRATQFTDKATLLLREPSFLAELPFASKREGEQFFNQLQALRNRIAHSDSILSELPNPAIFNSLLVKLRDLTAAVTVLANRSSAEDAAETSASA